MVLIVFMFLIVLYSVQYFLRAKDQIVVEYLYIYIDLLKIFVCFFDNRLI